MLVFYILLVSLLSEHVSENVQFDAVFQQQNVEDG